MITFFFFLLGIIIGSFLNVVICRLQKEETLLGRSHCTKCEQQIDWYDNIPLLSFLILRGKCRKCSTAISYQYPLVELLTGVVFAIISAYTLTINDVTTLLPTIFYLGLFSMLIVVFAYDLLTMYIPMTLIWIALGWTGVYLGAAWWFAPMWHTGMLTSDVVMHGVSGIAVGFFFWLLVWFSRETWMGMGDVYLALLVGMVVGWPGVLWAMTLSFGLGSVIGLLLIAFGKKGMKSQVPFAPFLVVGLFLTILLPKIFPILAQFMLL